MDIAKDDIKMIPLYIFVTILSTSSMSRCASLSNPYWDKRSVTARQGDTVNMTCFSHASISPGLRITHKDWPATPMWNSATATSSDDRYSVMYHTSDLMVVAQLTITDVQPLDAGSIGCTENSDDRAVTYTTLSVSPGVATRNDPESRKNRQRRSNPWLRNVDVKWFYWSIPIGIFIIVLICMCVVCWVQRFHKKRFRGSSGSPTMHHCMVEFNSNRAGPRARTTVHPSPVAAHQHANHLPDERVRQLAARIIHERETLLSRVNASPSIANRSRSGSSATNVDDPPPYAEAVATSVRPSLAQMRSREDVQCTELDSPPAYSQLGDSPHDDECDSWDTFYARP